MRTCAVVLAAALALVSATSAAATPRTTLPAIEDQVMCVTCKIPLEVAESPQANDERAYIQELIDRGLNEAQIKRTLVAQYGPSVLALPSTHGFDLVAYLVPVLVILALLALLTMLLARWRTRSRQPTGVQAIPPVLSPEQAELLDADMARRKL